MSSVTGYCTTCGRTVYLGNDDRPECPVCSGPILMDEMQHGRPERIAQNEAAFRTINERVAETQDSGSPEPDDFICECGDESCAALIRLTPSQYEAVRKHPARFFVVPGHEIPDVEAVVGRAADYVVVEKLSEAMKELVTDLDDRGADRR